MYHLAEEIRKAQNTKMSTEKTYNADIAGRQKELENSIKRFLYAELGRLLILEATLGDEGGWKFEKTKQALSTSADQIVFLLHRIECGCHQKTKSELCEDWRNVQFEHDLCVKAKEIANEVYPQTAKQEVPPGPEKKKEEEKAEGKSILT